MAHVVETSPQNDLQLRALREAVQKQILALRIACVPDLASRIPGVESPSELAPVIAQLLREGYIKVASPDPKDPRPRGPGQECYVLA